MVNELQSTKYVLPSQPSRQRRIAHDDRLRSFWARRDQANFNADMIRKEVYVLACLRWQLTQVFDAERFGVPSRQRFIDGLDSAQVLRNGGQRFTLLPIKIVAHTHFDFIKRVENIE